MEIVSELTGDKKLRVCMVVESAGAGVGRHVMDLVNAFGNHPEVDVHVAWSPVRAESEFTNWIEQASFSQIPISMRTQPGWHDVAAVRELRRYLAKSGPFDIVHGHSSKGGAIARLACLGTKINVVYTPHAFATMNPTMNLAKRWIFSSAEYILARMTNQLIAVSPEEAKHARYFGFRNSQVAVIPNGVRPTILPDRELTRKELGFLEEDTVIGFVGRMVPQKHPLLLVKAFSDVVKQFPQALLAMVGDGPLMDEVKQTIERRGISDRVRLLGARAGFPLMPSFDLFALSSRFEGLPYVALEAMSAGLPLIVTSGTNCSLLVESGTTGLITPDGDVDQFSRALSELVGDSTRRKTMGIAGKQRVSRFTVPQMTLDILNVYSGLMLESDR